MVAVVANNTLGFTNTLPANATMNGEVHTFTNTVFYFSGPTTDPLPDKYKVRGIKLRDERARWRNR